MHNKLIMWNYETTKNEIQLPYGNLHNCCYHLLQHGERDFKYRIVYCHTSDETHNCWRSCYRIRVNQLHLEIT